MRSRRTSPRRCCGRIIRRGRTANSPEPGVTRFDQLGLGSLLLVPNESSSSQTCERTRSDAALFSCPLLSKASLTRLGSPQPPPSKTPFPNPTLPAWESRGVQVLTDSAPALCICIPLSHSQGRAAEHFPAPPRTGTRCNRRFLPYQSWACGSLEVDSTAPLAGLCQKAHLERGGGKENKITSTLWVAELFLAIPRRKTKQ